MPIDRRAFLKTTGGAFAGFASLHALRCAPGSVRAPGTAGYGALAPAGPELALPAGFSYRALGLEGAPMSDGSPTPAAHDGMSAFPLPNGNIRLIRNHEIFRRVETRDTPADPDLVYDAKAIGGTTSLEIDPITREIVRDFRSLDGTLNNCAGGPTPWGSWLSCEESFGGPADGFDALHGYIFEVPVAAEGLVPAVPLRAMGRFVHEAVAVDAATGIVYETEDQIRSGLYRFLPDEPHGAGTPANLAAGGRLQMLALRGRPQYDTAAGQTVGNTFDVTWVDIDEPDPPEGADTDAVFEQGWARGGARFRRLEGCWAEGGRVYFDCTTGGDARAGQIWEYVPDEAGEGTLRLLFESPGSDVLDHPDNICMSPRGSLVLCEDGVEPHLFLRGLTPDGALFDLAQNIRDDSELAGSTFSPDGQTLFVNIQRGPGTTLAIWGPWERGPL